MGSLARLALRNNYTRRLCRPLIHRCLGRCPVIYHICCHRKESPCLHIFLNNRFIRHPLGSFVALYSKNPHCRPTYGGDPMPFGFFSCADILGGILQYWNGRRAGIILYATIHRTGGGGIIHNNKQRATCFHGIVGGISIQCIAFCFV